MATLTNRPIQVKDLVYQYLGDLYYKKYNYNPSFSMLSSQKPTGIKIMNRNIYRYRWKARVRDAYFSKTTIILLITWLSSICSRLLLIRWFSEVSVELWQHKEDNIWCTSKRTNTWRIFDVITRAIFIFSFTILQMMDLLYWNVSQTTRQVPTPHGMVWFRLV